MADAAGHALRAADVHDLSGGVAIVPEEPFDIDGHSLDIGISIGAALYPDSGTDATVLMQRAEVALEEADGRLRAARAELEGQAGELSERRRAAAPELARAVRKTLEELAMPDAQFEVKLELRREGCGPRGAETAEFEIAVNRGVAAGPLREVASGGELSRVMLALLSVAHDTYRTATEAWNEDALLVFDEVDAGIGGHTARTVGKHLRALAAGRQILCITHLPQIASLADRHFQIEKATAGETATTTVSELAEDGVVLELVRMLGASDGDRAAVQHARQLLRAA